MAETSCRYFLGDRPCHRSVVCDSQCAHRDIPKTRILVIHLEALGAVLRGTAVLPAIRRKYPSSHITWVTQNPAQFLLQNNPLIDRVLTSAHDDTLILGALEFDIAFILDKSLKAIGLLRKTHAELTFGFVSDPHSGAILPATPAAEELWNLGLNNQAKFFENKKSETQLLTEALDLSYQRDEYVFLLSQLETEEGLRRRKQWAEPSSVLVGFNTGCSPTIPYKKLTVEKHVEILMGLYRRYGRSISYVLLGGREDSIRNQEIFEKVMTQEPLFPLSQSSTTQGLRDGAVSVEACDIVVSGDSLGMHMAIALRKWCVAWFGPTCEQEIDLFDRGIKVITSASCAPCWKRSCQKNPMCYDLVDVNAFMGGVEKGLQWLKKSSSFRQPSLETRSSLSL